MEQVRLIYEQIEEAKKFMFLGSVLNLRLALILLDNVAELLMYNALQDQFTWDESLSHKQPKYTKQDRDASEKEFEIKLRILGNYLERITVEEKEILCICHRFRCGAFHKGLLRRNLLDSICKLLYTTVAALTIKLRFRSYSISGGPEGSPEDQALLRRFGIENIYLFGSEETIQHMKAKLLQGVDFDVRLLTEALSLDLVDRIDQTLGILEFLHDTADEPTIDHNLQYGQFWKEVGAQMMNDGHFGDAIDKEFSKWQSAGKAQFRLSTLKQWRTHALAIARQRKPGAALARFWTIDKRFGKYELDIWKAVAEKENQIDAEIEHRRLHS